MLAWLLAMASFGNPSVTILQEATRGTLEQLHLTPYRTWKIMFSRIVSQLLLTTIMAFILIVIIQITTNQWLNFNPLTTIPIMPVTFLSMRSEEHTSELQSRGHLVCRLLLEKKKSK